MHSKPIRLYAKINTSVKVRKYKMHIYIVRRMEDLEKKFVGKIVKSQKKRSEWKTKDYRKDPSQRNKAVAET